MESTESAPQQVVRPHLSRPHISGVETNNPRSPLPTAPRPHTMAAYWHFIIMVVGGIETMWLGSLHTRNLIKWEPIWCVALGVFRGRRRVVAACYVGEGRRWRMCAAAIGHSAAHHGRGVYLGRVVFVCWLQYIVDLAVPEAQWIKPEIANGEHVDWLRICGWMTTRRPCLTPPTHPKSTHTCHPIRPSAADDCCNTRASQPCPHPLPRLDDNLRWPRGERPRGLILILTPTLTLSLALTPTLSLTLTRRASAWSPSSSPTR